MIIAKSAILVKYFCSVFSPLFLNFFIFRGDAPLPHKFTMVGTAFFPLTTR